MEINIAFKTLETAEDAPKDPLKLFLAWYEAAEKSEPIYPNAMCLSTVTPDNKPDSRIVLMKEVNIKGLVFYTNLQSAKGRQLTQSPYAALNFYWKSLGRQVRISGPVEQVDDVTADQYYKTRPKGSRIGAWASRQSQPLPNRQALKDKIKAYSQDFEKEGDIDRPPHWSGFRVVPEQYEFWEEGEHRLHTRVQYIKKGSVWNKQLLYP